MLPLVLSLVLPLALAYSPGNADTPQAAGGADPGHESATSLADQVDLFNGGLSISASDWCVPGAYGLDMCMQRDYTSKVTDEYLVPVSDEQWMGVGWNSIPGGRIYWDLDLDTAYPSTYIRVQLPGRGEQLAVAIDSTSAYWRDEGSANAWPDMAPLDADGNAQCGEIYIMRDFSFLYRTSSGAVDDDGILSCDLYHAITTDGVIYEYALDDATQQDGWLYGSRVYDAHGDDIAIAYAASAYTQKAGALASIVDQDGRGLTFTTDASGYLDTMSYLDSNGTTETVDYTFASGVLTGVTFPTGETSTYAYAATYQEMSKQSSSLGGSIAYTYDTVYFLSDADASGVGTVLTQRVVSERDVKTSASTTEGIWTYVWDDYYAGGALGIAADSETSRTTEVIAPDGGTSLHTFGTFGYSTKRTYDSTTSSYVTSTSRVSAPEWVGLPTYEEWYTDSTLGTLVRWTYTDWGAKSTSALPINGIQITDYGAPYATWNDNGTLVPRPYAVYHGYSADETNYASKEVFGYVEDGTWDLYGNATRVYTVFTNPTWSATGYYYGTLTQSGYAWSGSDVLEGWNQVHALSSETTGTTGDGSTVSTAYTKATRTYATSGDELGWPASETILTTGVGYNQLTGAATANASDTRSTTMTYTFSSTAGTVDVTTSLGGVRSKTVTSIYGTPSETVVDGIILSSATVDTATGFVLEAIDGNGNVTTYDYDARGRPTTITPPLGDATTIAYTLVPSSRMAVPTMTATTGGLVTTTTFDGFGRVLKKQEPYGLDGSGAAAYRVTDEVTYSSLGEIERSYHPYLSTVAAGAYTLYTRDVLGREISLTEVGRDGSSQGTTTSYDWPTVTVTDALGNITKRSVNGFGDVATTTPPTGATASTFGIGQSTWRGIWTNLIDPDGVLATIQQAVFLDGAGQTWSVADPQSGTRTFRRNAANDIVCEWDDAGDAILSTYDTQGRLTSTTFDTSCTAAALPESETYYDGDLPADLPFPWTVSNAIGHVSATHDTTGGDVYSYDAMGRVVAHRHYVIDPYLATFWGLDLTTSTEYDDLGHVTSETITHGPSRSFAGNAIYTVSTTWEANLASTITLDWATPSAHGTQAIVTDVTRSAMRPASITYGNGVVQRYAQDTFDRLASVTTRGATASRGRKNLQLTYGYDAANLLTSITDFGGSDVAAHDTVGRLTSYSYGDDGTAIAFTYDNFGNMTGVSGTAAAALGIDCTGVTYTSNRVDGDTYSKSGNPTFDGVDTRVFDALGRQTSASDGTETTVSHFDATGAEGIHDVTSGGVTTTTLNLSDNGKRVMTFSKSNALTRGTVALFVYLNGLTPIAEIIPTPTGISVGYLHEDGRGNLRMVTDGRGRITSSRESTPYGPERAASGTTRSFPVEFGGHEALDTFDTAAFGVRRYSGLGGRFLTPDRFGLGGIGDPQSLNRYAYARMNPLVYVDPSGKNPALAMAYTAAEVGATAYDVYSVYEDYQAGNVGAVIVHGGLTALGVPIPGGEQLWMRLALAAHIVSKADLASAYVSADELYTKGLVDTEMIRKCRGVATMDGTIDPIQAGTEWIQGAVGTMPGQIANKLVGQSFSSFSAFRARFWTLVSQDPVLVSQLTRYETEGAEGNQSLMARGRAPIAPRDLWANGTNSTSKVFHLDHIQPLVGAFNYRNAVYRLYNLNNIAVLGPGANLSKGGR